ncbi:MAG: hypothetical protein R2708_11140 [Vicinamibacterales bacterium]
MPLAVADRRVETLEALGGEGEEDVVLAGEVAVDGRRAVSMRSAIFLIETLA